MKFLYDFFPILLFFLVYKFYGDLPPEVIEATNSALFLSLTPGRITDAIYLATAVAIIASFIQVSLFWLKHRRFERMHLVSLVLITVFGGATLTLQDPIFVKWKPTILNWLFATVFLGSHFIGQKTLVERMMGHVVSVPRTIWQRTNLGWVAFFVIAGAANLFVAYAFTEATWVDFKLFGLMGMTFIFVIAQSFYLARYMKPEQAKEES